jgi:hypothetical protein
MKQQRRVVRDLMVMNLRGSNATHPKGNRDVMWEEMVISTKDSKATTSGMSARDLWKQDRADVYLASDVMKIPVYVSVAAISPRISYLRQVIDALLLGTALPDRIFIFISADGKNLDRGVPEEEIPTDIVDLVTQYPISIVYTDNIGSHRKLLPILARFWDEDVAIVTVDDDSEYQPLFLDAMVKAYVTVGGEAVIAGRVRNVGFCNEYPYRTLTYGKRWGKQKRGLGELSASTMLSIPTGVGGVMYRPRFFHPVVFEPAFRELASSNDDITFRLATLIQDIPVQIVNNGKMVHIEPPVNDELEKEDNADWYATMATRLGKALSKGDGLYLQNKALNSEMWEASAEYLTRHKIANIPDITAKYISMDRSSCLVGTPANTDDIHCALCRCSIPGNTMRSITHDNPYNLLLVLLLPAVLSVLWVVWKSRTGDHSEKTVAGSHCRNTTKNHLLAATCFVISLMLLAWSGLGATV